MRTITTNTSENRDLDRKIIVSTQKEASTLQRRLIDRNNGDDWTEIAATFQRTEKKKNVNWRREEDTRKLIEIWKKSKK